MTTSLTALPGALSRLRTRWTRLRRAPRHSETAAPPRDSETAAPPRDSGTAASPRDTGTAPLSPEAGFALPLPAGVRCGLARVVGLDAQGRPVVRLDDAFASQLTAEWALPYRYQPAEGDLLVTVGRGPRQWVIGVAHGRGRSELAFRGDFTLAAGRALRLQADRGLRLVGRVVTLRARSVELVVGALQERLGGAARLVAGLLEEVAGSAARVTEEEETLLARDVTIVAEESVRLDGELLQIS